MNHGTPSRRCLLLVGLIVLAGLILRLYHYVRDPVVWSDEGALLINVLDRSFREQLGPLSHEQSAPPLALWVEKGCALLLGESTYALRLPSLLASCLSLLLLAWLLPRLLPASGAPWAALLAAFSDRLLWHSCEAKPYSFDVLVATAVPALFLATSGWRLTARLLLFALVAPLTLFLSYPAVFVSGGLLLALLPEVWRARAPGPVAAYALLGGLIFVSFLVLLLGPIRAQRIAGLVHFWRPTFPSWSRPWSVPWWSLRATVAILDYCFRPVGGLLAHLVVIGGWLWFWQGQRTLLTLLAGPVGLGWLASLGHAYPYAGTRLMVYALPCLALLIGSAVPVVWAWSARWLPGLTPAVALTLLLAPAALSLYRLAQPWDRPDWNGAIAHVLKQCQPCDTVAGDSWEVDYYFRRLGPAYRNVRLAPLAVGQRVWVVLVGATEEQRQKTLVQLLGPKTQLLQQRAFPGTGVYCLGPTGSVLSR